jgi:hypothetical protein
LRYALRRTPGGDWTAESPTHPPFGPADLPDAWAFLEWRAIEDVIADPGPDATYVHAGATRVGERLVLLVGGSGSGKSTLTALFLARGYPALGDDVLRFAPSRQVFEAVGRSLKLDDNTLPMLGLQTVERVLSSPGTFLARGSLYVSPEALCERWESPPVRPWGMVILEDAPHEGPARLDPRSAAESAVRVLQSLLGDTGGPEARTLAGVALLESLQHAVAFQARGADPVGMVNLIVEAARN